MARFRINLIQYFKLELAKLTEANKASDTWKTEFFGFTYAENQGMK